MAEDELVRRILDEADIAARPGQYERLVAIANEVARLDEMNVKMAEHVARYHAEVAALREQMSHMYQAETFTDTDGYPSTRVFKAEVVGQNEWAAHIRREVLADLARAIDARYQDIKGQPGHDRNPEYWDGVLDGLDIAEQIVEKEVQP